MTSPDSHSEATTDDGRVPRVVKSSRRGQILQIVTVCLVIAVTALLVSKLDLLGADSGAKRKSEEIYQRITAQHYSAKSGHAPEVSVIYLDDGYNASMHENSLIQNWPPSYTDYANILTQLTSSLHNNEEIRPKAIFLDIIFTGSLVEVDISKTNCAEARNYLAHHCGQFRLLEAIEDATKYSNWPTDRGCQLTPVNKIECIIDAGGIPVILARITPEITERWSPFQAALAERSVMSAVTVDPRQYPVMRWEGKYNKRGIASYDLSPASALFAAHCLSSGYPHSETCQGLINHSKNSQEYAEWPEAYRNPQSVVWGGGPQPVQKVINRAANVRVKCPDRSFWTQAVKVLKNTPELTDTACLHSLSGPYHEVAGPMPSASVKTLLADRLVLVGIKDVAGSDWILSQVHGNVPGVFLHAMALDNLIRWGPDYRQISGGVLDKSDWIETGLLWFLLTIGTFGVCLHKECKDKIANDPDFYKQDRYLLKERIQLLMLKIKGMVYIHKKHEIKIEIDNYHKYFRHSKLLIYISLFALYVGAIFVAIYCALKVGKPEPVNWLGVYQTSLSMGIFQLRKQIGASLSGVIRRNETLSPLMDYIAGLKNWFDPERIAERSALLGGRYAKPARPAETTVNTDPVPRIDQAPKTNQT